MRGGIARGLAVDALGLRVGKEAEALQPADEMLLDVHGAVLGDLGVQLVLVLEAAHQRAGAPVDEALRQLLVQRVRQAVLDRARAGLPVLGVGEPVGAVGHERPGADVGDAVGERVDVAVGAVGEGHLLGEPVLRDALLGAHQELVERGHQLGVVLRRDLAVVGDLADVPQPAHGLARRCEARDLADRGSTVSSASHVVGHARARRGGFSRGASRRLSRSRSSELKSRSRLRHCSDFTVSKVCVSSRSMRSAENGSTRAGDAERAVVHVAAGAAGDLAELGRRQLAMHLAVELARAGEGDVIDVEVEAHADGVGGDQEVDVARLVERHLRVARARAERAQHDGRAAALAADQLGDGVDLGGREGDDAPCAAAAA